MRRLVFEAADEASGAVAKATITQAINRWLGHRVVLDFIKVDIENATITVDIRYRLAGTEESHLLRFQRSGSSSASSTFSTSSTAGAVTSTTNSSKS